MGSERWVLLSGGGVGGGAGSVPVPSGADNLILRKETGNGKHADSQFLIPADVCKTERFSYLTICFSTEPGKIPCSEN